MTGKERHRGGVENTKIRQNSPFSSSADVVVIFVSLLKMQTATVVIAKNANSKGRFWKKQNPKYDIGINYVLAAFFGGLLYESFLLDWIRLIGL